LTKTLYLNYTLRDESLQKLQDQEEKAQFPLHPLSNTPHSEPQDHSASVNPYFFNKRGEWGAVA
jgi:hypothetical protein